MNIEDRKNKPKTPCFVTEAASDLMFNLLESNSKKPVWKMTKDEFESSDDVVYHGGRSEYRIKTDGAGRSTGNPTSRFGAFFTPSKEEGKRYVRDFHGGKGFLNIARLDLKNPYKMSFSEFDKIVDVDWNGLGFPKAMKDIADRVDEMKKELRSKGHDAIIIGVKGKVRPQEIAVFDDSSITQHKYVVEDALASGKDVPDNVLADYPDLARLRK